ncbi:Chitinase-like protein 1, partial [Striga hermonthica]
MAVVVFVTLAAMAIAVAGDPSEATIVNTNKHGKRKCIQGWECSTPSPHCCGYKISDFFKADDFEKLFPQRNSPEAQAAFFYSYESFIQASAMFQPQGFCTSGNKTMQMKELAAFFAFVAAQTS